LFSLAHIPLNFGPNRLKSISQCDTIVTG
jgi:hypothetical protein